MRFSRLYRQHEMQRTLGETQRRLVPLAIASESLESRLKNFGGCSKTCDQIQGFSVSHNNVGETLRILTQHLYSPIFRRIPSHREREISW